ncbi:hypothetical protein IWX90DRAFT_4210 [Phyllosticta citrichinensis]|uniref:Uncharacterized protein n=1 Tax=Phyllosticta citrichinensis TaxID=1130410 RepID=A0ABR1Y516_9PEZI
MRPIKPVFFTPHFPLAESDAALPFNRLSSPQGAPGLSITRPRMRQQRGWFEAGQDHCRSFRAPHPPPAWLDSSPRTVRFASSKRGGSALPWLLVYHGALSATNRLADVSLGLQASWRIQRTLARLCAQIVEERRHGGSTMHYTNVCRRRRRPTSRGREIKRKKKGVCSRRIIMRAQLETAHVPGKQKGSNHVHRTETNMLLRSPRTHHYSHTQCRSAVLAVDFKHSSGFLQAPPPYIPIL